MAQVRTKAEMKVGAREVGSMPTTGRSSNVLQAELDKVRANPGKVFLIASFAKPENASNRVQNLRERYGHFPQELGWEFQTGPDPENQGWAGVYASYSPDRTDKEAADRLIAERKRKLDKIKANRAAKAAENGNGGKAAAAPATAGKK